jgi:antirestriction protein ArdC
MCRCRRLTRFGTRKNYYATLAHEMTHWTRYKLQLQTVQKIRRALRVARGASTVTSGASDKGYAMEELVAELGAAFLSADLDLTPEVREDHASYLGHWLKVRRKRGPRKRPRAVPRPRLPSGQHATAAAPAASQALHESRYGRVRLY